MKRAFGVGFATALALGAATGEAKALDAMEAFQRFLLQPSIQNSFKAMLLDREPAAMRAECSDLKILESNEYDIVEEPKFEVRGGLQLVSGIWVQVFVVDRCGTKTRRRLLIRYNPATNSLEPRGLLPGDFHGGIQLEFDTIKIVLPAVLSNTHCNDPRTLFVWDIKSLGEPVNGDWSENWKVQSCGNISYYRVEYSQTGGTTIIAVRTASAPETAPGTP